MHDLNFIIIGFGILYIGSNIVQAIIDSVVNKLHKNHESKCDKTEHYYQYSEGDCKTRPCRDKKPMATHIII